MYLTYDRYQELGGCMDAALFPRFEAKARSRIDAMTFGRLRGETPARDSVVNCMFELVEAMHADEQLAGASGREIAAVSNDGVSVTYAGGAATAGVSRRYSAIVRTWLAGETDSCGNNLMYAGVRL